MRALLLSAFAVLLPCGCERVAAPAVEEKAFSGTYRFTTSDGAFSVTHVYDGDSVHITKRDLHVGCVLGHTDGSFRAHGDSLCFTVKGFAAAACGEVSNPIPAGSSYCDMTRKVSPEAFETTGIGADGTVDDQWIRFVRIAQ